MESFKEKILKLRILLRYHDYLYFSLDSPIISDLEYDILLKKLEKLETKSGLYSLEKKYHPIGSVLSYNFDTCNHIVPMLSLDNTFTVQGLKNFYRNIYKKINNNQKINFFCDLKFDGLALSLLYKDGKFIRALTRGNGIKGEDVTQNAKFINNIPLFLSGDDIPDLLEVRGEVCMLKSDFHRLNSLAIKNNDRIFSNTRNAASGSLRQHDVLVTKKRNLFFYCYGYSYLKGLHNYYFHSEQLKILRQFGFFIHDYCLLTSTIEEILDFYFNTIKIRESLSFDIDGVVIKLDSIILQNKIGYTSKFPKWAIAFKFYSKSAYTKIINVKYQVGRTGIITPVAYFQPVFLSGAFIQKASLYNKREMSKLNLRFGDTIIIERIGDVIPKITGVLTSKRSYNMKRIVFTKFCPSCNSILYHNKNNTFSKCYAFDICMDQKVRVIEHFFSKFALNAVGFGISLIRTLVFQKYINKPIDCFYLEINNLSKLKHLGKKSLTKIVYAIKKCKYTTLNRFIYALGIDDIGIESSNSIAKYFGSLEKIMNCNLQQLHDIKYLGSVSANNFFKFIQNDRNIKDINDLILQVGIVFIQQVPSKLMLESSFLLNKRVVCTGTFSRFSRSQIKDRLLNYGAIFSNNVSKNTDFLISGKNPGSKILRARQLNIKIIKENEIDDLIK
ncbi:NAD-dependent DNA ligase LigA [Buchnera aphidicola]|uniref:NAD-dependent DNA ligase LigA n=1 Tax=Buchnera aphidicola TaxID=9 RepID=UPI003463A3A5